MFPLCLQEFHHVAFLFFYSHYNSSKCNTCNCTKVFVCVCHGLSHIYFLTFYIILIFINKLILL